MARNRARKARVHSAPRLRRSPRSRLGRYSPWILDRGSLASVAGRGRDTVKSSSLNVASSGRISSGVLWHAHRARTGPPDTGPKLDMDGHPLIRRSSARSASLRVVPPMMPGWTGLLSAFRGGGFSGPPADPPRARSIARPGRAAAASLTAALRRRRRTDHPNKPRHRRCRQARTSAQIEGRYRSVTEPFIPGRPRASRLLLTDMAQAQGGRQINEKASSLMRTYIMNKPPGVCPLVPGC
jgi:hypothetical protein